MSITSRLRIRKKARDAASKPKIQRKKAVYSKRRTCAPCNFDTLTAFLTDFEFKSLFRLGRAIFYWIYGSVYGSH